MVVCAECGSAMQLRPGRFGSFYGCTRWPECDSTHGAHPDGAPLGIPADAATRHARVLAHDAFDGLWKTGRMKRRAAYAWLQRAMGLPPERAHIGRFTAGQCTTLVRLVRQELERTTTETTTSPSSPEARLSDARA
jgi:ssDNA-binding Zn-finger/Zn-ribbon topoisomerase 1